MQKVLVIIITTVLIQDCVNGDRTLGGLGEKPKSGSLPPSPPAPSPPPGAPSASSFKGSQNNEKSAKYGQTVKGLADELGATAVVTTTHGNVRGTKRYSRNGNEYCDFRGIPYAKPPIKELRYEPPVEHEPWGGVLACTEYKPRCNQALFHKFNVGDEDCLYLNIFARSFNGQGKGALLPVMFWIHGGMFMSGSGSTYPPLYFMDENVVLVTINYRLSSFGFLNTGDGVVKGNMGLKDQSFALKWVKRNIQNFGGDPNRITIFGESAGSTSVHLQTLSPLSIGLFSGAIMHSGTAIAPWSQGPQDVKKQAEYLATKVGCTVADTKSMVTCLKALPAKTLSKIDETSIEEMAEGKPSVYGPTVELPGVGAFIDRNPLEILKAGNFSKTPVIMGVNNGEGVVYLMGVMRREKFRDYINDNWERICSDLSHLNDTGKGAEIFKEVMATYMPSGAKLAMEHLTEAQTLLSDRGFFLDNHDVAVLQSKYIPTYLYYYTYQGIFSLADLLVSKADIPVVCPEINYLMGTGINYVTENVGNKRSTSQFKVAHADELALFFNLPLIRKQIREGDADLEFSKKIVALWSSFARTGQPDVSKMGVSGFHWEPVRNAQDEALNRLELGDTVTMIKEPFFERLKFWKDRKLDYL